MLYARMFEYQHFTNRLSSRITRMFNLDNFPSNWSNIPSSHGGNSCERQHTKEPVNTGSSVIGVKFNGGVVIAADTLSSFGSMARYQDCARIIKVNNSTVLGAGGDFADFQHIQDTIQQRVIEDECIDDGFSMKPKALYNWLTGTLYRRRSKFNPLWNIFLVAGVEDGVPFLGFVDKLGTAFQDNMVTSGFGSYLAMPLIRKAYEDAIPRGGLTEDEAKALMEKCIEVLYYRDGRSWPRFTMGIVDNAGVRIVGPIEVKSNWTVANFVSGY